MNTILLVLLFLFVYNVPFSGVPLSASKIVVVILFVAMIMESRRGNLILIRREEVKALYLAFLMLIVSVAPMVLNGTGDISIIYSCLLMIINHMLGSFMFIFLLKFHQRLSLENIMKMLVSIATAQSVIIILMMISKDFYSFISSISFLATRNSIYLRYGGARGYGLASSITYELGVVQSFSLLFIAYFLQKQRNKIYYIYYVLICISILVTGRTALFGVILSLIYLIMTDNKAEKRGLRLTGIILIIAILVGVYFISNSDENSILLSIRAYVFESLNNYKLTGKFSTRTGTNIENMFKSMRGYSLSTWLLGDGRYKGPGGYYYGNVDVGFLRHVLYFGIFGCLFVFVFYLYIFRIGIKNIEDKNIRLIWKMLFIYLIVAHIKGDFVLGCGMGISIILLLFYTSIEEKFLVDEESTYCKSRTFA